MRNPFSSGAFGQTPDPSAYDVGSTRGEGDGAADERVRLALEAADYPYEVSLAHNFRVILNYSGEGRTQLVIVNSHTATYRGREWRKVWSEAFDVTGQLSWAQALALLTDNNRRVFGSWYTEERGGRTYAGFQVSLPADASPAELEDMVLLVGAAADEMEKATVGSDAK